MWHVLSVYAQIRLKSAPPFLLQRLMHTTVDIHQVVLSQFLNKRKLILKVQIEIVTD